MRRTPAVLATLPAALLIGLLAPGAEAVPPVHESRGTFAVPPGVRAVVVDVDGGDVSVHAGSGGGQVHKQWTTDEPGFTSTFSGGTLRLTGTCNDPLAAGGVYVRRLELDCAVDLDLAVPAGVSLTVSGTTAAVSGVQGDLELSGLDGVSVDHAGPGSVRLRSDAGPVALRAARTSLTSITAYGAVTVKELTSRTVTATSRLGAVSLTAVDAPGTLTVQADDELVLDRADAPTATLTSASGTVSVTATRLGQLTAHGSDTVTLDGVTATTAALRSDSGRVRVLRSRVGTTTATAYDSVAVTLQRAPSLVRLESTSAWVSLVVPRRAYSLTTRSRSGSVTVEGIVVDPRSSRHLELTAETDISVTRGG